MALTLKRARFVSEYLIDMNATQAAIRAGYSPKTARVIGQHLLTIVAIQEALAKGIKRLSEKTEITQEWVMEQLKHNYIKAIQEQPVMVGGEPTGEYIYQGSVANRALELMGKHIGMFNRVELTGKDGDSIIFSLDLGRPTEEGRDQ